MEVDPFAPLLFAIKLGLYGSALLAAGLGLHASLNIIDQNDERRALRSGALAALAALSFAALRLALANIQLGGVDALFDSATMSWTWPALGPSSLAIAVGAAASVVGWLLRSRIATGAGAIAFAASFALTGHSQALEAPGLAPWAVATHVLIAAFWFAAPITLWPTHDLDVSALTTRVGRFSTVAVAAIPILFALGLWLALLLAGGLTPLLTSLYGQLLLAKFAAASFALALGAYNKATVNSRLQTAPERGLRALKLTLSFDIALFAIALTAVAAATTITGPPSP